MFTPRTVRLAVPTDRIAWIEHCAIGVVVLGFLAMNVGVLTRSLEYDELVTASYFVVNHTLWQTASTMAVFNNHIAYSVLAGLAVRLFGTAEWVLRMPAFVLGAATIYMAWRFGRFLSNAVVGLCGAALLALSPFFIEWTTWPRLFGARAHGCDLSYSFLVLIRQKSLAAAVLHGASSALGVYFHLYGVWVVFVQWLVVVWLVACRRSIGIDIPPPIDAAGMRLLWRSFLSIAAVALVLYLPVLGELVTIAGIRGRSPVQPALPSELFHSFVGADSAVLRVGLVALCLLGLARQHRIEGIYLGALLGLPFVAMWLIVRPVNIPRFFVYWTPVFTYLIADGTVALTAWAIARPSRKGRLLALAPAVGASVIIGFVITNWIRQDRRPASAGYREFLQPAIQHDGWRLFVVGDLQFLNYYLGKYLERLDAVSDVEQAINDVPRLLVVYHNVNWNTAAEQQMARVLRRRCSADDRQRVTVFRCVH